MRRKRVLVTGGSGFIGKNLVEQLQNSCEVFAPSHRELELTDSDSVEGYIKKNDFHAVVHSANIGENRVTGLPGMTELNLRMFFNIARCKDQFGRMIQLGSGGEYGKQDSIHLASEEQFGERIPADSYSFYKYVCSKYASCTDNITCLRIFGCYGKHEDYGRRFISNAICRSILGMPIVIKNRNALFSYLYVDDLAPVISHFIENKGKHTDYNVVPDETTDLLALAKTVQRVSGNEQKIEVRNEGPGPEYTGSNRRLREEIPSLRFTTPMQAIQKLCRWYGENKSTIDKSVL